MRLLVLFALAACERSEPTPAPPPTPVPAPAPAAIDDRLRCDADTDCELFVSCCAHCGNGIALSIRDAHREIGEVLAPRVRCESCSTCTAPAPNRVAICKRGACARRETWFSDPDRTVAKVVEVDTELSLLDRGEQLLIRNDLANRACGMARACGVDAPVCRFAYGPSYLKGAEECRVKLAAVPCAEIVKHREFRFPAACAEFVQIGD